MGGFIHCTIIDCNHNIFKDDFAYVVEHRWTFLNFIFKKNYFRQITVVIRSIELQICDRKKGISKHFKA